VGADWRLWCDSLLRLAAIDNLWPMAIFEVVILSMSSWAAGPGACIVAGRIRALRPPGSSTGTVDVVR
jgi:hypothetical protein